MASSHLLHEHVEADATELARGPGEVVVDHARIEADGFEDLRAGVRADRRDAHLRHHLQDALAECLDEVVHRVVLGDGENAFTHETEHRVDGEIRVYCRRSVADEQSHVVDLSGVTALDDEPGLRARPFPDEMVVHRRGEQERRDRREFGRRPAVRKDDDVGAGANRLEDLVADRARLSANAAPPPPTG